MSRSVNMVLFCGVALIALGGCNKKTEGTKSEMTVTETVTTKDSASTHLKEGLWALSMKNDKMPMVISSTVCVGKDGIADIEKASKSDVSPDCSAPTFSQNSGKLTSDISCDKDGHKTDVHSEMAFSDSEHFTQTLSMKMQDAKEGITDFKQTIEGTYKGACPEGMKVGDVKMNFAN